MDADDQYKNLRRLIRKVDQLAVLLFLVVAIAAARLTYPTLAAWVGPEWGTGSSIALGIAIFFGLVTIYPE